MPDAEKSLTENLLALSASLTAWSGFLSQQLQTIPDDRRLLRAALRAVTGALHYYAREARTAANEAR